MVGLTCGKWGRVVLKFRTFPDEGEDCMQDTFARATHSAGKRDDRVSCIQGGGMVCEKERTISSQKAHSPNRAHCSNFFQCSSIEIKS